MKPLGKSSRTLRRTLLAIVIFALSFMIYYPVAQRPVYARDSLRNFFNYELAIVLLVTFLFSVLEDSDAWGFIFGNILNWGLVFGYHFFFGYPYWLIVLYLIGGGLFFGFIYFFVAAVFCGFSIPPRKCSNCGKKGFFLRTRARAHPNAKACVLNQGNPSLTHLGFQKDPQGHCGMHFLPLGSCRQQS